jgi:integrase
MSDLRFTMRAWSRPAGIAVLRRAERSGAGQPHRGSRRNFGPGWARFEPRVRGHDLRHTCASLSLAVAPKLHVVKERLGHEDIRTTINVYGHSLPSVDQALADGLGALFGEAADNVVPLHGRA